MPKKKPMGRPTKYARPMLTPINVRFPAPVIERLEKLIAKRGDGAGKAQVIRELVIEGLARKKV